MTTVTPTRIEYQTRGVLVSLTDEEYAQARNVGDGRNAQMHGVGDMPYYNRDLMEDDATASFAAACAEAAVAQTTGLKWHAKVWHRSEHHLHKNEPDVGDSIEVRRIRSPHNGLCVRQKDLGRGKFIFVAYPIPETDFRQVDVIGWMPADRAWEVGYDAFTATRRVPLTEINIWRGR